MKTANAPNFQPDRYEAKSGRRSSQTCLMKPAKRSTLARSTRRKEGRSAPTHMTIPRKDARSDRIRTTTRPKDEGRGRPLRRSHPRTQDRG